MSEKLERWEKFISSLEFAINLSPQEIKLDWLTIHNAGDDWFLGNNCKNVVAEKKR